MNNRSPFSTRQSGIAQTRTGRSITAVALWLLMTLSSHAQEFRAAWADVFHVGMGSQTEVNNMVSTLVSGHYNAVIVQVLGYMDNTVSSHGAHWKSSIVPWSSRVTASFDPLAYLCQQAHANGIEVHAWLGGSGGGPYRVSNAWPPAGNSTLAAHPEWMMVPLANSEGGAVVPYTYTSGTTTYNYCLLDMGSPDAQEYLVSIVRELVTGYPIDGINWDDEIDGPQYNPLGMGYPVKSVATYPNSGLARYQRNTGFVGTPGATDSAYNNYRRRFKNELMARMQAEIQSIKTNPRQPLRHTSAALAYSPVPGSCDFSTSVPYTYYCDWAGMLQNGWVDAVVPQTYSSSSFNTWADRAASCWQYNRNIFPGIGAYLYSDATIASEINYTRSNGLKGNSVYSYAVPNSAGNNDWWAYAAANVYTDVVSTPPMPWRNPATATEGIVWGRVKDFTTGLYVDDATVTLTGGPTVKSDGNGYYIATLVPAVAAGTAHAATASKNGMISQATNVIALAGDIVRYDFILNSPSSNAPAAPSGLTATAVSSSQINLSWTDNATNETALVVARGTVSGSYADLAVLPANSTGFTNTGLTASTTYYYVVRATNGFGDSLNSAPASATTLVNPAPVISGQPQSQIVVVNDGVTFSATVTGTSPLRFQWKFNGALIAGATNTSYTIASTQYSDGGNYAVTVTNSYGSAVSSNATLTVLTGQRTFRLTNIWNIQAGSRTYVTTGSTERGICINPFTGHVLLVSRSAQIAGSLGIFVLDGSSGTDVGTMNLSAVNNSATFPLNKIDVAEDGVIYGANLTTLSSSSPFIIYRWANEAATATVAYTGSPDGGTTARWGDSFSVTGAGLNTRIVISGSSATNTVLFTTSNGTNFIANKLNPTPAAGSEFSKGLFLVGADTVYVKNRSTTTGKVYNYSVATNTASVVTNLAPLDNYMIGIAVATNFNLLAGVIDDNSITNSGHSLKVYDISSPASPVVVSNFNFLPFGSGTNSGNANFAAGVDTDGTRIVAVDTQNGVVALQIIFDNPPPRINTLTLLPGNHRRFQLNSDPGNFVMQASSDFTNWLDLSPTQTNGLFDIIDPVTNSPMRFYRTKN